MSNYAPYLRHLANGSMQLSQLGLEEIADSFEALEARVKELEDTLAEQGAEVDKANALIDDLRAERNLLQRIAGERFNRLEAAEAELARLKAQEAVGYFIQWDEGDEETGPELVWCECSKKNGKPLYAEPRPAAQPQKFVAPDYFEGIISSAVEAAQKAMLKFPQPNYVLLKVAEEAGEVVQAGVHYAEGRETWEALEGEVIQTIAMLYRLVTEGDHINGVIPPKAAGGEIAE